MLDWLLLYVAPLILIIIILCLFPPGDASNPHPRLVSLDAKLFPPPYIATTEGTTLLVSSLILTQITLHELLSF